MADDNWQTELAGLLAEKGHTPEEIQKIVARVQKYDSELRLDSVMDSIAGGRFDLSAMIAEALKDPD